MTTDITVRGSFTAFEAPQRATLHAVIGRDGPDMDEVYDHVVAAAAGVATSD